MPTMTVKANATTRTTAGGLGNPQLRSSRTAGASKNVSRIARANGRKTALAKYIVAITPNTASTVMDRAITTSFMPRSQTKFFQGDVASRQFFRIPLVPSICFAPKIALSRQPTVPGQSRSAKGSAARRGYISRERQPVGRTLLASIGEG